jgi:hypothetical protein
VRKPLLIVWLAVAAAVVGVPLLLFAGREPPCPDLCASGKAELTAIVPTDWRPYAPVAFQAADPEQRRPFTRWDVQYIAKGNADDAVRRLDAAARRAGWQAEPDCRVPDRIAGCRTGSPDVGTRRIYGSALPDSRTRTDPKPG